MNKVNASLNLAEIGRNQLPSEMFAYLVLAEELTYVEDRTWVWQNDLAKVVAEHFTLVVQHTEGARTQALYTLDINRGCYFLLTKQGEVAYFTAASRNAAMVAKVFELLNVGSEEIKKERKKDTPQIQVDFWTVKNVFPRRIEAPRWREISGNYPDPSRSQLDALMNGKYRPSAAGQLILWHGLPGTGKTYALRALGREWRKWAKLHYITDPDQFFGSAQYMLSLLLSDNRTPWEADYDEMEEESEASKKNKGDGWKIIIAEDTGELLAADAKQQTGQGLSRLLNVVDGMIGQGLRVCVLITTNEELKDLHSAVTRPGRCGALIPFGAFSIAEGNRWLEQNGAPDLKLVKEATLAEMFAMVEGRERRKKSAASKVGF